MAPGGLRGGLLRRRGVLGEPAARADGSLRGPAAAARGERRAHRALRRRLRGAHQGAPGGRARAPAGDSPCVRAEQPLE